MSVGDTNDPGLKSWVQSANQNAGDFPIQNLPFGVYSRRDAQGLPRIGVAIGDCILDLRACYESGLLNSLPPATIRACSSDSLNDLMALGRDHCSGLRQRASELLRAGTPESARYQDLAETILFRMDESVMSVPAAIGDYTDFYASINHARNVGSLFRPDAPLLPNYKYVPIAYHGRASSIVVSGTAVSWPQGQTKDAAAEKPTFGPSRALDYELEVGFFLGKGNARGERVPIEDAEGCLFGACLVNDWSARDIQAWEYQPLGPFLAKSFATTISPWIVTMDALEPFRAPAFTRPEGDPEPLRYLSSVDNQQRGAIDITLEIQIVSAQMRRMGLAPTQLCRTSFREMYWTVGQMVTHHTSNGCNLRPGDLIAGGTVSGTSKGSLGSMLELTRRGEEPASISTGELRKFLEDGDEIIMRGYCQREGYVRIGFGECRGVVMK